MLLPGPLLSLPGIQTNKQEKPPRAPAKELAHGTGANRPFRLWDSLAANWKTSAQHPLWGTGHLVLQEMEGECVPGEGERLGWLNEQLTHTSLQRLLPGNTAGTGG